MKSIWIMAMFTLLVGLWLIFSSQILKAEPLQLEHFSIDAWKTLTRRDPYQPEYTRDWNKGGKFNFNLRVADFFSWKNEVHFDGTPSQLQHAGWAFDVSYDRWCIQPFYFHHSQHAFDDKGVNIPKEPSDFPLIDRYGLRFVFYQKN